MCLCYTQTHAPHSSIFCKVATTLVPLQHQILTAVRETISITATSLGAQGLLIVPKVTPQFGTCGCTGKRQPNLFATGKTKIGFSESLGIR